MKTNYLFDVDGTLTQPRRPMEFAMSHVFIEWCKDRTFFLVTGSDINKLTEQIPKDIAARAYGIFTSMANELRIDGSMVYENKWEPPIELLKDLVNLRTDSDYPNKKQDFLEERLGMINFTTAGRDSNLEERQSYCDWDAYHREREAIAGIIEKKYPRIEARLGGQISIDIQPRGHNKSLASKWVRKNVGGQIVFVGDKCHKGGNDHDIVLDIKEHEDDLYYPVKNSLETFELLGTI